MKKKISKYSYYLIIFLCLSYITSSIFLQTTYYKFSSENVKNTIEILTSKEYEGRLTGSSGNNSASILIENKFNEYNLKSPFKNTYRESFNVITPIRNENTPSLNIIDNNYNVHEYSYGTDFKENMLSFKSSEANFTKNDTVDILTDSIIITQDNKKYLFKVNTNNDFSFRSSFIYDCNYEFCINITTHLYNDILDSLRNGCSVSVKLPFSTTTKSTSNIIGVIKGTSDNLPPLILTAHYDHIGVDALGNYYNGALDNASGTAFILELSKSLSTLVKPERDIIFVALTGEEFGLLGSKYFVSNHLEDIQNSDVINFDMIGAPNIPITFMLGTSTISKQNAESFKLVESLESLCDNNNLNYSVKIQDSSDHASFANAGISAVTICHSDLSKIHTPNDSIKYIDSNAIDNVYTIVKTQIYNSSYNKYLLLLYNPITTFIITLILISIIIIKHYRTRFLLHKSLLNSDK